MRLAERQGVLQGRGISRVQRFALEVLRVLDARSDTFRRSQEFRDSIKRAILTNNPARAVDLWPEWFHEQGTDPTTVNTAEEIEEALEDGGPTTWIMPDEPLTEEEAMRMIEELSRQSSMTLTSDDLDDDSGWQ